MKKKIFGITLAVCLIVLSIASTTMAYFTDTDDETKVFTAGKVDIELNNDVLGNSSDVYPGMEISKGATVKNVGNEDAYVGIIISFNKQFTKADVIALFGLTNVPFTYNYDGTSGTTTVYIVKEDVLAKNNTSVTFFSKVVVPTTWGNSETAVFNNAKITVTAYATQVYGFDGAEAALKAAFPDVWGGYSSLTTPTT